MNNIPYINIAEIGCWIVYNMPFDSEQRHDYDMVNRVQNYCYEKKIFGMGWAVDIPEYDKNTCLTEENASRYVKEYSKETNKALESAIKSYMMIKKGDYVITRNKNGHYYVGCVSSEGAYYLYDKDNEALSLFSWGCSVSEWVEFKTELDVPSEIVGRFSQRFHSAIQKINKYRQRFLVISMYENSLSEKRINIPKLKITESNFVASLNYKELEDLVALFIANRHRSEGYSLLPSSCKASQQNIEYYYVAGNRKPITCQVKNKNNIEIDHYIKNTEFEKIYIFCGLWNEETIKEKREKYKEYEHIYIISPGELYKTLQEEPVFSNPFYEYGVDSTSTSVIAEKLTRMGYEEIKQGKLSKDNEFIKDDDFICFAREDGLFYSKEFSAIVLSYHILPKDISDEARIANKVFNDINKG